MRSPSLVFLLVAACGGQASHDETKPDASPEPTAKVGGPCLVNVVGDCYMQACYLKDNVLQFVTRTPINDAGADACDGVPPWP
jgi:hypothetical protein